MRPITASKKQREKNKNLYKFNKKLKVKDKYY